MRYVFLYLGVSTSPKCWFRRLPGTISSMAPDDHWMPNVSTLPNYSIWVAADRDEQMSVLYDSIFSSKWREHEQHGGVCSHQPYLYIYRFNITWEIVSKKLTHQICFFVGQFVWFHFFQSIISTFRSLLSTSPQFHGNQGNPLCYPPSKEGLIAGY